MTKRELAFKEINQVQDYYINELIEMINSSEPVYNVMKVINFNSPTGTGKTKMMSKLINRMPDYYFIITTLSKGQLNKQIEDNLKIDCIQENYSVYGSADYRINSKLQAEDILREIPSNVNCIWLRDEGHIKTNRYERLLLNRCYKVINFSATNRENQGITCNFTHTMMLRSVNQTTGTPEDAIQKLLEVKCQHKDVQNYNPCAIFRCVSGDTNLYNMIVSLCLQYKLKYIDISEETYNMADLCRDDNEYDVLINKFKIVEGIDIRRAHVLYMDNQPSNNATTIQVIGRCRRNALLYRDDIDILAPENAQLLKDTRECYVFYNVEQMRVDEDETGELQATFCEYISCESLKPNITISVIDGQLPNGLFVLELKGQTGTYNVEIDKATGFNVITPLTNFYDTEIRNHDNYIYVYPTPNKSDNWKRKIHVENISKLPIHNTEKYYDYSVGDENEKECEPYYVLEPIHTEFSIFKTDKEYPEYFEDITEDEKYLLDNRFTIPIQKITLKELEDYNFYDYKKIINDRESAIIGVDLMHQIKDDNGNVKWTESKSITSKVNNYNKFSRFIEKKYNKEYLQGLSQCFTGENDFDLDKKCMSALGYCVEYYSKYLVYGETYLSRHIVLAQKESFTNVVNDFIIVRACMLKYKEMMINSFGKAVAKVIKPISVQELIKESYKEFVNLVIELGSKAARYVKDTLYSNVEAKDDTDPNLTIRNISGLADYITKDTILDIKVRNNIDAICVKQVLGYHYLSTKRSDLQIKKVIIYDATSGKSVVIWITDKNRIINSFENANNLVDYNVITADFWIKDRDISEKTDNHVGEINYANNGQRMAIIDYRNYNDIDIQFEDGTIVQNVYYNSFNDGKVRNPNFNPYQFTKTGEKKIAKNGQKMTIVAYRSNLDLDVQFEDGTIVEHKQWSHFVRGDIGNPNYNIRSKKQKEQKIGEICTAKNGQKMTIIDYRNSFDMDIQFEDGTIVTKCSYGNFKKGMIKNPNLQKNPLGESNINNQGLEMTIIGYRSSKYVDVKFEDGTVVYDKQYDKFIKGKILNPNYNCYSIRLGETNTNNQGLRMTIVKYNKSDNIDIQFDDKTIVKHKTYSAFKSGMIKNPNYRIGEMKINEDGEQVTIISYRTYKDIDIEFEDGTIVRNTSYKTFIDGKNKNPNFYKSRLNESKISNNGQSIKIIAYRGCNDIDVQFEDGTIINHRRYSDFCLGTIKNPNFKRRESNKNKYIGISQIAKNGQKMTIIDYRGANDIDIEFEDGTIVKNRSFGNFKKGLIKNPKEKVDKRYIIDENANLRIGEVSQSSKGQKMVLIAYRSANDIDVEFEDGTIVKNKKYAKFKAGLINNPNLYIDRFNETCINKQGQKMTIIVYRSSKDIDVQFDDGTIVEHRQYDAFKKGTIMNHNRK